MVVPTGTSNWRRNGSGYHHRLVYVDSLEVVVDSYYPPRTNSWDLNTICRQTRVGCRQVLEARIMSTGEIACKTMYQNKSKKIKKRTKDKYLSTAPKMPVDSPAQIDLMGYWQR
ncbi:hypothetical protein Taro_049517 [Colocasia esculenta]|uniref:Uncharacterized protein n=1 Tax=Colocasia esculenta TaxID=4460 RepID=A0A843XB18_COLES|nr:hypothetical protein [Colocasia esculenta]